MERTWTRDYVAEDDGEVVPRISQATAFLSDIKDQGPPAQSQTWRTGEKAPFGQMHSLRAFEKLPQVQTQALRDFEKAQRVCRNIKWLWKTKPLNSCVVLVVGVGMVTPGSFLFFTFRICCHAEKHLNDLKKENFSLKLRIYFLEERMQQKYEASREDIYKRNIELKVEVESLKRELQDRKRHLDKTWANVENLNSHNEAELRRQFEARQQEAEHVSEPLEHKTQESKLAKNAAALMAAQVEAEKESNLELSEKLKGVAADKQDVPGDGVKPNHYTYALAQRDKRIEELSQSLATQEKLGEQLSQGKQQPLHLLEMPASMGVQDNKEVP